MKRMFHWSALVTVLIMTAEARIAPAQVPLTMSYQGLLTNGTGTPVPDGDHLVDFRIYAAATDGAPLWTENDTVTTVAGQFAVLLGSKAPLAISFDQAYWLGVSVDGGEELVPRISLAASPYSLNARTVVDNAITSAKIGDDAVGSSEIAVNAVGSSEIASGAVGTDEIADGVVRAGDLLDEPGVAYQESSTSVTLSTTPVNVTSLTINVPGPGYVIATANVVGRVQPYSASIQIELKVSISTTSATHNASNLRDYFMHIGDANSEPAGFPLRPLVAQDVFPVASAGARTFHLVGTGQATCCAVFGLQATTYSLVLLYVPTAYGSVTP